MTTEQALNLGLQHHRAGRVAEAEALYRQILAVQPDHGDALHLLGVINRQAGRNEAALEMIGRALLLLPNHAGVHSNYGEVLRVLRRHDEAMVAFRRAVELQPQAPEYHFNLGNALLQVGRREEALAEFAEALRLNPGLVQAHFAMGVALMELNRLNAAVAAYQRGLHFQPGDAQVLHALGYALSRLGRFAEALESYDRALVLDPKNAELRNRCGTALAALGKKAEAIAAYRQAVELREDYADAWNNLAALLTDSAQFDEAIFAYGRALVLAPEMASYHSNLGATLARVGRFAESIAELRQALTLDPDCRDAWTNLIFTLHFDPRATGEAMAAEQRRWSRHVIQASPSGAATHVNDRDPERRLRIGYVSSDLRDHVVGRNLRPLLTRHDHRRFEIFCYSCGVRQDEFTAEFQRCADHWRHTATHSSDELAAAIRNDGIDILVDLAQHTSGNRLLTFARKPAPVQVSFAGYPESAGLETIEYRISDQWLEGDFRLPIGDSRLGEASARPETLETAAALPYLDKGHERVYLIDSFWCYDPGGIDAPANDLPAKANGNITFGCLNNFCKINEPVLGLWARILRELPGARLVLLSPPGSPRQRTLDFFAQEGISAQRIEFVESQPREKYFAFYHRIDIGLDTFPYNGHTTSLDALWMGVPVVSLAGERPVSRGGLSQLSNLGLPELAAGSKDQYAAIAAQLARDLPRLSELRRTLRPRMEASVLMDAPRFSRSIEAAYRAVWRRWCAV